MLSLVKNEDHFSFLQLSGNLENQPFKAFDLGVFPLSSPNGRDDANSVFDDALPDFPLDDANLPLVDPLPSPVAVILPPFDVGTSTLWPKW